MDQETSTDESEIFSKQSPDYPGREYQRGQEGWVVIDYSVGRGGVVEYYHIRDSSGNGNFDDSAVAAVQSWRYEPGEERELSVFFGFVQGREKTPISKKFHAVNKQANELIDEGQVESASEILAKALDDDDLTVSDLSYAFLTEGRIAGEQGDRAKQLELYRKALAGNGRWLAYDNYLEALHGTIILELDQGDIASAVRDYDLLTSTLDGKQLAGDLEDPIVAARTLVNSDPSITEPYDVADISVVVRPDQPARHYGAGSYRPRSSATSQSAAVNKAPSRSGPGSRGSRAGSRGGGGSGKD